jgi:hypothetical protein
MHGPGMSMIGLKILALAGSGRSRWVLTSTKPPEDRAIVARYFPGVLENDVQDGMGFWVLIARNAQMMQQA